MAESRDRLHSTFSVNDWAHGPIAACPIEASLRRGGATTRKREAGGKGRERRVERCSKRGGVSARALSFFGFAGPKTGLSIPSVRNVRNSLLLSFAGRDISISFYFPLKISSKYMKRGRIVFFFWEKGARTPSFGRLRLNQRSEGEEEEGFFWREDTSKAHGIGAARDLCRFSERRMLLSKM